ncbi:MAG: lycopene cyclase [Bacteroidetes bacterium]|nr:lycopene cyclase [Bacteroidota bacterium]
MPPNHYHIAIIGAGAAGLQLALAMRSDPFFAEQRILLLEKDGKDENDRTWCFWEKGEGKCDSLLTQSWAQGDFFYKDQHHPLNLLPYRYKMLRGLDFYRFAKQELAAAPNITWLTEEVVKVANGEPIRIVGRQGEYSADWVFDSRLPEEFLALQPSPSGARRYVLQPFKGWVVRTPDDRFDPTRFTMMDYRLRWRDTTSFTYVLPMSAREALVEFTLFVPTLPLAEVYEEMLRQYFDKILKIKDFEIVETEFGIIPMTDFPFEKYSVGKHIRIGTAGGWVKPSSGYSFKNCERNSQKIIENLKAGRPANTGLFSSKFRFYDSVFLGVLQAQNKLGPSLFNDMYAKNDIQKIFAFLDNETTLTEDLGIISSFPKGPFLQSFFNLLTR